MAGKHALLADAIERDPNAGHNHAHVGGCVIAEPHLCSTDVKLIFTARRLPDPYMSGDKISERLDTGWFAARNESAPSIGRSLTPSVGARL